MGAGLSLRERAPLGIAITTPSPFQVGDIVIGRYGWATVREMRWEVPRTGKFWTEAPHWRAVVQFGPLASAPLWDLDARTLRAAKMETV